MTIKIQNVRRLLGLAWLLLVPPAIAQDKPTVKWIIQNGPPWMITQGDAAGRGWLDQSLKYLFAHTPEFHHVIEIVPLARTWDEIRNNDGVCFGAALKTPEREKFAVFSRQAYWLLPHKIMVRKSFLGAHESLVRGREVDFAALVTSLGLTGGGLVAGSSYGADLDAILNSQPSGHIVAVQESRQIIAMLASDRLDWVLGYPDEFMYLTRKESLSSDQFITLDIKGHTALTDAYVTCSNGPLGRRVIAAVNRAIGEAGSPPVYGQFYSAWLDGPTRAAYASRMQDIMPKTSP
jgi:uncharacterized protein (TIGR02285 family)